MELLPIKDNSTYKKDDFSFVRNLTSKIANKTLGQLEKEGVFIFPEYIKEAEDISTEQMILQEYNDTYRSGNVMGFLGYGDERLIIRSRFSTDGNDFFFQYLLEQLPGHPNIVDFDSDADPDKQLFNFLIFLFPHYLKSAMRKGLYKKYVRKEYNDGNVKGTVNIARHIKKNTPFTGRIAYSQREFSYDNSLIELVRHTVEYLKGSRYRNSLLNKVKEEVRLVTEATPGYNLFERQKIIDANKKNTVRHAYYREYLALQRLCLLILQHQKHHIGSGSKHIYGILFDGTWLWEEYVNSLICEHFFHPNNKSGVGKQYLFNNTERNIGLIYPDFISHDCENRIIADAKYKHIENIGNKDYLQVLAYMFRFDAKAGYYLYPNSEDNADLQLRLNKGSTFEENVSQREDISVKKLGLKIPVGAKGYEDFKAQIKESENEFRRKIIGQGVCTK